MEFDQFKTFKICSNCGLEHNYSIEIENCVRCNSKLNEIEKVGLTFNDYLGKEISITYDELLNELKHENRKDEEIDEILNQYYLNYLRYCYKNNVYPVDKFYSKKLNELFEVFKIEKKESVISIKIDTEKLMKLDGVKKDKLLSKIEFILTYDGGLVPEFLLELINKCNYWRV